MPSTRRQRIHVIAETTNFQKPDACAALRLVDPFSHPAIADLFEVSFGPSPPAGQVDLLVLQRLGIVGMADSEIENFVRSRKAKGTRLLYDIDDNLLDPHPTPQSDEVIAPRRRLVRFLLRNADQVTVSTSPLAQRVRALTPRVSVVPNALDERRLPRVLPVRSGGAGVRIGYFGTFTHMRDLMTVAGPIRAALSRLRGKATVVLCGVSQDTRMQSLFDDLASVEIMPATSDYDGFMKMMLQKAHWDIGLAPLAMGQFEATKSDIKFLEYASFGIPGVYSQHPAYAAVQHGVTGMVASPDQWAEAMTALADDSTLRERIVAASRDYLFSQRTLAAAAHAWVAILKKLF